MYVCVFYSLATQIECEEWMHLNPGYTSLPPIAEWRLPFLPKVELWKLISKILSLHIIYYVLINS